MRRTAFEPVGAVRWWAWIVTLAVLCWQAPIAYALPAAPAVADHALAVPDWLSLDGAARLDLGFDVLLPEAVPAPFDGEPDITAYERYYSLYWVIPATPPTFLQVTGEVGGTIPDYSKYDRNVQLEQNAAVSGSPAYRDLTPIYDLVYWEASGVVYSVESQNLADTDSLALANALVPLAGEAGGESTGGVQTGDSNGPESVVPAQVDPTLALSCPDTVAGGSRVSVTLSGAGSAIVDAGAGSFPAEAPNTEFAADADGGDTLVGTVPDSGSAELVWLAPAVDESQTVYLFATTQAGETPGECDVLVTAARADTLSASADQEVGASDAAAQATEREATQPASESTVELTAATKAKPTKTPKGYDEVIGLPTAMPLDDGTGGADGRVVPTPTIQATATVRPTPTLAPTSDENGMVAQTIGPGGGTLESPLGISVTIPEGALEESVTLSIQPVGDAKLPPASGVQVLSSTGFDVAMAASDGVALTEPLRKPAEVRIAVDGDAGEQARLYRVDGARMTALANTRHEDGALVVSVTEFSRFVAGVPATASVETRRNVLPFVLAAVVVILVMVGMVLFGGMIRPRRQRIVVTRRPSARSRYR